MPNFSIPGNTAVVSDDWNDHRSRGSLGGTDFVDGPNTPMRAMATGVVTIVDNSPGGSGGRYIRVLHDDGNSTELLHGNAITIDRGTRVALRQMVGLSGGSGYGSDYYYGPHIHAHAITPDGTRYNVEPYINWANPTVPAGSEGTPIEEDTLSAAEVQEIKNHIDARVNEINNRIENLAKSGVTIQEDLKNAIRRDGGNRDRLLHDGGDGHNKPLRSLSKALQIAHIRNGKVTQIDTRPDAFSKVLDEMKADGSSIMLPKPENSAAQTTVGFFREVDAANDPNSPFGSWQLNWIDLDPDVPGTTWMERSDGTKIPYPTRQDVWKDLRRVTLYYKERMVKELLLSGKQYSIVLSDGSTVNLTAASVARADAQIPGGQIWSAPVK